MKKMIAYMIKVDGRWLVSDRAASAGDLIANRELLNKGVQIPSESEIQDSKLVDYIEAA